MRKCISALDSQLRVTPLQYTVQVGLQQDGLTDNQLRSGDGFQVTSTTTEQSGSVHSLVKYDLLGKIAENTQLTRGTAAAILTGMESNVFGQFKKNPEHFIAEASRIVAEQKATMIIERLEYNAVTERYGVDIFTANQTGQNFSRAIRMKNHVYDYVVHLRFGFSGHVRCFCNPPGKESWQEVGFASYQKILQMKKSRYPESQIFQILKEAEAGRVARGDRVGAPNVLSRCTNASPAGHRYRSCSRS